MTQEELIREIKRLPPNARKAILDILSELESDESGLKSARTSIVDQLYGIAKPNGPAPSDEELKEDYIRYLTEKYS